MPKRHSYTADFKLSVVQRAEDLGSNRKAAEEFGVNEKSVREWKMKKTELANMNPKKRARRGRRMRWPYLEEDLKKWVVERREKMKQSQQ